MADNKIVTVLVNELPDNERLIFKLIFSVSARSKNRTCQYALAEKCEKANICITGSEADSDDMAQEGWAIIKVVSEKSDQSNQLTIQRPLIATRVLSSLDKVVTEQGILEKISSAQEQASTQQTDLKQQAAPEESAVVENNSVDTESQDVSIDFSITEEEASELAIVHDDTLANPANAVAEEDDETEKESAPSNVEALPVTERNESLKIASGTQTALVVDDSASVRKQLEIELGLFDVQVDFAEDAERAFDLLSGKKYDVAFLDVVLPDTDGYQICKKVKNDAEMKSTKVIMLTGKATHADKVRGSLAGCDAYLVKPVGRSTFQKAVKKYLKLLANVEVMEA